MKRVVSGKDEGWVGRVRRHRLGWVKRFGQAEALGLSRKSGVGEAAVCELTGGCGDNAGGDGEVAR